MVMIIEAVRDLESVCARAVGADIKSPWIPGGPFSEYVEQ